MNQNGQTSVEYILLIVVVVSISTAVFKQLEERIVGSDGITGKYLDSFSEQFSTNYQYFTLRR